MNKHLTGRFGTPIPMPVTKEIVDPGINFEISEQTIKDIEEIEENSKRAEAMLAYCWHWYV